jgi:hypothetical protein
MASAAIALTPLLSAALEPGERIIGAESIGGPVSPLLVDADLRRLPPAPIWTPGDPITDIPRRSYPAGGEFGEVPEPTGPDPLVAVQQASVGDLQRGFVPPVAGFAGQGYSGVSPPDPVGDVGRGHFIQAVNSSNGATITVYDLTGATLAGPFLLDSLGAGSCSVGYGDPIVLYDRLADRWFLQEFAQGANFLCVYVSQGPDPVVGGWYAYQFATPSFPDYPHFGVWHDAYYATANESTTDSGVYALDRTNMLAGATARPIQRFGVADLPGYSFNVLTPADLDGDTLPPAGAPGILMRHHDEEIHLTPGADPATDRLEIYSFAIDWVNPGGSVLSRLPDVVVTDFNSYFGSNPFSAVPQPASATRLDPIREVILNRLQYRRFPDRESLVGVVPTNLDTSMTASGVTAGLRWFELRRASGNDWTLHQEGTFQPGPDTENRFVGAIAMDGAGNLALAYSFTDTSGVFPSLKVTGRDGWTGGLGVMTVPEQLLVAGAVASGSSRWGDYAAMGVDPVDDRTFWFTGEYMPPGGGWATWIAAFRFDNPIFADDFESGTANAWSHVEP